MKRIFSLFIVYLMLITPIVAAQETGIRTEPIQFTQEFTEEIQTEPITFTEETNEILTQTGEISTQIDNLARQLAQEEQPNIATTQLTPPIGIVTDANSEVATFDLGIDEIFGVTLGESDSQTAINVERDKQSINKQIQQLMPDVIRGPTGNPYCTMTGIGMPETTSITGSFIEITGAQTVKLTKKQKRGELQASLRSAYSMGQTYYDHTRALTIYTGGSNFGSTKYGGLAGAIIEQTEREIAWHQDKAQQNAWGGHTQNYANFGEGTLNGLLWFAEKAAFAATNIRAYHYKYTDTVQLMGQAISASENPGGAGMYGLLGRGAQYGGKEGLATYYNTISKYQSQMEGSQTEIDNANNNQRMNSNQKDTWAAQANAQSSAIASEISVINTQIAYLQGIGGFAAQYQLDLLQDQKNSLEQQQSAIGEQLNAYNSGNWDKYWQGQADNAQNIIDNTQKNFDAFKKDPFATLKKAEDNRRDELLAQEAKLRKEGKLDEANKLKENINKILKEEFRPDGKTWEEKEREYSEGLQEIARTATAKGMSFEDASIYVGFSDMIGGFNSLGVPTGLTGEISQFVDDIILGAIPEVEDAIQKAEEMQKMIAELSDPTKQQEFKEELDKIMAGLNDVKGRLGGLADDALGLLNKMPQLKQMLDKMAEDGKFSKKELQEFLAQFGIAAGTLAEMMAKFIQLMKEFMSWIVRMKNLMNDIWYADFPQTTPIGIPEGAQWCTALCPIDKYSSAGQCIPPHQFEPPAAPAAPIVPGLTLTSAEAEAASGGPGRPPNLHDRRQGGNSGGAIGGSDYGKDQNVYYEDMTYYDEYGNEVDVEYNGRTLEDGSWEITITINGKEHKINVPKDQQDKYKNIDDYINDLKNDPTKWLYEKGPDGKSRYRPGFEDTGITTFRPPGYYEHDDDGNITGDGVHITIDEDGECRSYNPTGEGSQEDCKAKAKKAAEDAVAAAETTPDSTLLGLMNQLFDVDAEINSLEAEKAAVPIQPYSYLDATPEQQEKMKGLDIAAIDAGNELSQAQTEQAVAEKTFDDARAKYTGAALRDWLNSAEAESLRAPLAEANRELSDAEAKMKEASQARDAYAKDTNAEARAEIQAKIDDANGIKALINQAIKAERQALYDEAYQKALDDCAKGKLNKDDCDKYKRGLLDDRIDSLEDTLSEAEKDANAKADEALRKAQENAAKTGKSMTPEDEQKIRDKAFNDAMEQNGGNAAKKELDDLENIREAQDFQQKTQRCDEVIAELTEKYTEPYKEQLSDLNAQLGSPGISPEEKDNVQAQINKINGQINAKLRADHSYEFCQGVKERAAAAILGADAQNFAQKMADARIKIEELNVKLQDALKELTEKIKRFEERMDVLNARMQQLQERLNEANKYPGASNYQNTKTNLENEIQKTQNEINEIEQDLATERNKINQIYEELEKTRNEITTAITEQITALGTDPSKWTFEQQMTAIMLSSSQTQLNDLILKIQDDMSYLAYQLIREIALPDLDYEGHKYYSQEALQRIQQYIGQYVTQLDATPPTIFEQMFIGEMQRIQDRATTRNAEIESIRYVAQEYTPEILAELKEYAFLSKLITGLQKEINSKLDSLRIYEFEGREEEATAARNSLRELQERQQKYAEQRNSLSIDDNENIDSDLRAIIDAFRYSVTTQDFNNALNKIQQKTKTLNYELTIIQKEIDDTQKEIDNAQQQIQQTIAPEQRVNLRTKIDILTRKLNDLLNKQQQTKTINDLIKTHYYGDNGIMAKYYNSQIDAQQKTLLEQQKANRESRDSILNYLSPRDMVIEPLGLMTDRENLAEDKTYFIQQVPLTGLKILAQLTQKGVELDQITKDNIEKLIEKHGIYVSDEDRKALEDYVEYYLDYDIKTQTGTLTIEDQKNHLSKLANELANREHYELASQYATEIATISEDKQGWERLAGAWNSKAEGQTMITWAMELSDITLPGLGLVTFLPSLAVKITGTATRGVARIVDAMQFTRASNFLVKTVDVTGIALKTITNAPIATLKTIFGTANKTAKGIITITGKATDRIIHGTKTAEATRYVEQVQTAINKGLPVKPKDLDLLKANKGINDAKRFINPARAAQRNAQNIAQALPQQAARAQALAADAGRWGIASNIGRTIKGIGETAADIGSASIGRFSRDIAQSALLREALQKVTTQIDELTEKYYRHATLYPDDIAGLGKIGDELSTISRNYDKIADTIKQAAIARQTRIAQIRRASNNLWENSYITMKKATGDRLTLTPTEYLQATRTGRINSLANFNRVMSNYGKGTATLDDVMDAVKTAEGAGKLNHAATTSELAGKTTMNMIEQSETKLLDVRNKIDEIFSILDEAGLPSGRAKGYNADQDLLLFGGEIRIRHETAHFKLADEINEFTGFAVYDGLGNPTKLITQDGVFKIESMTPLAGQRVYNTIQELTGATHFNELNNLRNAARQGELGGLTPQVALQLDILKGAKIGEETLDATQLATRMEELGNQAAELQSRLGRASAEAITPPAIARIDETPIQTTPRIETPTPPSTTRTLDNLYDDIATRGRTTPDGIDLGDGIIARQLKGTFEYFDETGTIRQLDEHIMLFKNQEPYAMIRADGTIVTIEKLDDLGIQGLLTQQMRQGLLTTPRIIETLPQLRVGQQIADISKLEPTAIDEVIEIAKMTDDSAELAAQEARINSQIDLLEQEFIKASEEFKKTTGQDFTIRTTFEDIPSLRRITGCAINCPIEMQYVIGRAPDEIVMVRRPSSIEFYEKTTTGQHQLVKIVKEGERNFDQLSNIMSITTTRTMQAIPDKIAFDLGFYKASETGVEQLKVLEEYRAQTRALEEYAARVAKKQLQLYRKGKLQGYNAVAIRVQEMEYPRVLVDSRTPDRVVLENGHEIDRITTEMKYVDEYDYDSVLSVNKRPFVQITSPTGRRLIIDQNAKIFEVISEQNGIPKLREIGDFNAPEVLFPDFDKLFTGEITALPGQIARSTGIVELSEDVLRNIEQLKQQKAQLRAEAGISQLDVDSDFYLKTLQEQPTTAKTYADYLANPKKHYSEKGVQDSLKWYEQQGLNPETLVLETENTIRGIKNGEIRGWKYTDTATQAEGELGGDLLRVKEIDLGDGTLRTLTFIGDAEGKLLHGSLLKSIVNNKIDNVIDDIVERAKLGDTDARALLDDPAEIMKHVASESAAGLPTGVQHTLTMSMMDEFGKIKFVPGGEPIYGIRLFDDGGKITAKIDILGVESAAMYGQRGIGNPIKSYDADFDIIIQPTDGLWEQFDKYGTMFGEERLMQTIKRSIESGSTPEKLRDDLLAEIADFVGDAKRNDDLTFRLMAKTDITPRPMSEFAQEASKEIKSIPTKEVNDYVAARKVQPKRIDELVTAQTEELVPAIDEADELIPALDEADELVPVLDEFEELSPLTAEAKAIDEGAVFLADEALPLSRQYDEMLEAELRTADMDLTARKLTTQEGFKICPTGIPKITGLATGCLAFDGYVFGKGEKHFIITRYANGDIDLMNENLVTISTLTKENPLYAKLDNALKLLDQNKLNKLPTELAQELGVFKVQGEQNLQFLKVRKVREEFDLIRADVKAPAPKEATPVRQPELDIELIHPVEQKPLPVSTQMERVIETVRQPIITARQTIVAVAEKVTDKVKEIAGIKQKVVIPPVKSFDILDPTKQQQVLQNMLDIAKRDIDILQHVNPSRPIASLHSKEYATALVRQEIRNGNDIMQLRFEPSLKRINDAFVGNHQAADAFIQKLKLAYVDELDNVLRRNGLKRLTSYTDEAMSHVHVVSGNLQLSPRIQSLQQELDQLPLIVLRKVKDNTYPYAVTEIVQKFAAQTDVDRLILQGGMSANTRHIDELLRTNSRFKQAFDSELGKLKQDAYYAVVRREIFDLNLAPTVKTPRDVSINPADYGDLIARTEVEDILQKQKARILERNGNLIDQRAYDAWDSDLTAELKRTIIDKQTKKGIEELKATFESRAMPEFASRTARAEALDKLTQEYVKSGKTLTEAKVLAERDLINEANAYLTQVKAQGTPLIPRAPGSEFLPELAPLYVFPTVKSYRGLDFGSIISEAKLPVDWAKLDRVVSTLSKLEKSELVTQIYKQLSKYVLESGELPVIREFANAKRIASEVTVIRADFRSLSNAPIEIGNAAKAKAFRHIDELIQAKYPELRLVPKGAHSDEFTLVGIISDSKAKQFSDELHNRLISESYVNRQTGTSDSITWVHKDGIERPTEIAFGIARGENIEDVINQAELAVEHLKQTKYSGAETFTDLPLNIQRTLPESACPPLCAKDILAEVDPRYHLAEDAMQEIKVIVAETPIRTVEEIKIAEPIETKNPWEGIRIEEPETPLEVRLEQELIEPPKQIPARAEERLLMAEPEVAELEELRFTAREGDAELEELIVPEKLTYADTRTATPYQGTIEDFIKNNEPIKPTQFTQLIEGRPVTITLDEEVLSSFKLADEYTKRYGTEFEVVVGGGDARRALTGKMPTQFSSDVDLFISKPSKGHPLYAQFEAELRKIYFSNPIVRQIGFDDLARINRDFTGISRLSIDMIEIDSKGAIKIPDSQTLDDLVFGPNGQPQLRHISVPIEVPKPNAALVVVEAPELAGKAEYRLTLMDPFRVIRFASEYDAVISPETLRAMKINIDKAYGDFISDSRAIDVAVIEEDFSLAASLANGIKSDVAKRRDLLRLEKSVLKAFSKDSTANARALKMFEDLEMKRWLEVAGFDLTALVKGDFENGLKNLLRYEQKPKEFWKLSSPEDVEKILPNLYNPLTLEQRVILYDLMTRYLDYNTRIPLIRTTQISMIDNAQLRAYNRIVEERVLTNNPIRDDENVLRDEKFFGYFMEEITKKFGFEPAIA